MPEQLFISFSSLPRYSLALNLVSTRDTLHYETTKTDIRVKDRREMDSVKIKPLRRCSFFGQTAHLYVSCIASSSSSSLHHLYRTIIVHALYMPQQPRRANVLQRATFIMHVPFFLVSAFMHARIL